ncbi:MAG: STT3 domain-containing protein [Candidatus Woesearchaeota archaeon]
MVEHEKDNSASKIEAHQKEEDLAIDFSGIKKKVGNFFKGKEYHESHISNHKEEEESSLGFSDTVYFFKKNAKWLIPLACILIAIFASVYLRTMPQRMPVTDDWAQNTVYNYYQQNIITQINQQYPNLPAANKQSLVDKEWQKYLEQNKDKLDNDITQISLQYKDQFRDANGTLYLLGIDPYYYYQQSKYILENGHPGNVVKDGEYYDSFRLYPLGAPEQGNFHTWIGAYLHQFMNFFGNFPLMYTFFFIGVIFSALSVIPAFFIGKRISGNNVGGFFVSLLIAVTAFFVQRTTGESSDTDVYVVFFPLLITWLFLEALEAKQFKNKMIWIACAGLATGLFVIAWSGWWYVFDFILVASAINIIYLFTKSYNKDKKENLKTIKDNLSMMGAYIGATWVISGIIFNFSAIWAAISGPLEFIQIKAVAVESLWPNILTTVAELNVAPFSQVISQLGGNLLFILSIIGVIIIFLKKKGSGNYDFETSIFLIIWFIASLYATTKGVRFILQATPVFAITLGSLLGISWGFISNWTNKELHLPKRIAQVGTFILLAILLIQPVKAGYDQAYQSVPSINDGWYNTLNKINIEAPQKAVITSWWDFGYWFMAIAQRPTTFDGGMQFGTDAYWVGKSLLSSDEKNTVGIVRMLNCGQNSAFDELDKTIQDTHKSIEILNYIVTKDKEEAIKVLLNNGLTEAQAAAVIQYTHCDAPTDYFITSEDMVGKASVWGHFGSWNFTKAEMYQEVHELDRENGIKRLQRVFNLSTNDADRIYSDIKNTPPDQWISPWPGYVSNLGKCTSQKEDTWLCAVSTQEGTINLKVALKDYSITVQTNNNQLISPYSLVYATKEGIKEKKFTNNTLTLSAVLIPDGDGYVMLLADPALATSTFTKLFFFEGHGSKCFSKFDETNQFTGGKISTWVMDYSCKQENRVYFLPVEEVNAAHLLISTNNRTDKEALELIESLSKNITAINFGEYAKEYSEDPGSATNGGNLGWFKKGEMVPQFEQVAFGLKKGEISAPFKTQFGYHILYLKDRRTLE